MREVPYPDDYDRLRSNIGEELQAQRALQDLPLDDAALDALADAVTANIDYAFEVHWKPRWVKNDDPHRWSEAQGDDAEFFVDCLRCRRIIAHPSAAEADDWWAEHVRTEHA